MQRNHPLFQQAVRRGRAEGVSKGGEIVYFSVTDDCAVKIIGNQLVRDFLLQYFLGVGIHCSEARNARFLKIFAHDIKAEAVYCAYFCGRKKKQLLQKVLVGGVLIIQVFQRL